ncbi:hypothetical protein JW756_06675 [Candidatus Woesearchaeota archaeon]|nr:hypothetical protein [Candidatus Woesearchaeota archaeon]
MVNIGIDFDGVIADTWKIKVYLARKYFGMDLDPKNASKQRMLNQGVSPEVYDQIFRRIMTSSKRYLVEPVPFSKDIINTLHWGNKIYIITSRHDDEINYIDDWLNHVGIKYHKIINTSDTSKNDACLKNQIRIFLDDDLYKLEEIRNDHIRLFLLRQPYNEDVEIKDKRITSVRDWREFYEKAKHLL